MHDFIDRLQLLRSLWGALARPDVRLAQNVERIESSIAAYTGIPHAIGVGSGTDALMLALKAGGIGPGDEVLVPAVGFISTASAVRWIGARPVFVDCTDDLLIDPVQVIKRITVRTKALCVVHLNGQIPSMQPLKEIASTHNLFCMEDAAQALGATQDGKHPGTWGDVACLSFNPSKILTAFGGGGMLLTRNSELADVLVRMSLYGARAEELYRRHTLVGIASRLQGLQAVVLNHRFMSFRHALERRRAHARTYEALLPDTEHLTVCKSAPETNTNGYRFVLLTKERDALHAFLRQHGVHSTIPYGVPLPYFEAFQDLGYRRGDFPVAERIAAESLVLPTAARLSRQAIEGTALLVKRFFSR